MEGKTITKVLELESGYQALLLDDEEVAIVKVVTPDLSLDELRDFVGLIPEAAADPEEKKHNKASAEKKLEKKVDPEPEPEGDDYTWADLEAMGYKELKELCNENDLGTDPADYGEEEVDEFRKEVAEEIGVEVLAEEPASEAASSETPDDTYTWEDLVEMDYDELNDLCDENSLNTDPNDFDEKEDEDKLRRAIAKEINITPPPIKPKKK